MSNKQQAQEAKANGNKEFSSGNNAEAVRWYSKAIELDPSDHLLYSNRAAAYLALQQYQKVVDDCDSLLKIKNDWSKGYYRKGSALLFLKRYDEAISTLSAGLKHDPANDEMKKLLNEANNEKKKQPAAKPSSTKSTGLDAKAEGNNLFKESRYEKAIESYTVALETVTDANERSIIYSNRALCYHQLRCPDEVVRDCNESLALVPTNVKSLLRRGFAYEALDKHKKALEDFQQALQLDPTSTPASEAVSRISKALQQFEQYSGKK